ncbi:hypothetical protein L226DRAFT_525210 [Lentinus tigrinus ALCF2SS1-7]|uniref:uncharacterized protein n=1 Tax=Lentinus tigrinus ALCF2SS1-7 TaxID=1328758 RepID=UPI00116631F4|nr:hypothetical protein L226DRAFT_525210 [Lentinus tigrinus ALCF2SS1-7]
MSNIEVLVDDSNPLVIKTCDWLPCFVDVDGVSNNVSCAQSPGSVSLTYNFSSVHVWAYYVSGHAVPQLACTVDGRAMQVLDPPETSGSPELYWQWHVCQARGLPLGNHTVEVTVISATPTKDFCFNKFDVVTSQVSPFLQDSGGNSTSTILTTSSISPPVVGMPMVGFAIGGIVLTLLICGASFYWYGCRRQHRYAPMSQGDDDDDFEGSSMHSRRLSPLASFSFRPWDLKKQNKGTVSLESGPPVSIRERLLERSHWHGGHPASDADEASGSDDAPANSVYSVQEDGQIDTLASCWHEEAESVQTPR